MHDTKICKVVDNLSSDITQEKKKSPIESEKYKKCENSSF